MLYLYNPKAGQQNLILEGDDHRYLFKVRRHKAGETMYLRNLEDGKLHRYLIETMDKRTAMLVLQESLVHEVSAKHSLHIGWCVIDPKNVEKMLPSLNEMGVEKITFIYCKRSQKDFKLDFKRMEKILLNSSQQCGRSKMMQLETTENLKVFVAQYPQSYLLNFSEHVLSGDLSVDTIVVGCEGGLSDDEVRLFESDKIVGFDTPLILKSESAACAVAAKILF